MKNSPNKECKVIIIKMLIKLRQRMNEPQWELHKGGKYKKVQNKSQRAEQYNSWTEKNYGKCSKTD